MILDHTVRAIREATRHSRVLVGRTYPAVDVSGPKASVRRIIDARLVGEGHALYALELGAGKWFEVLPTDEIYTA